MSGLALSCERDLLPINVYLVSLYLSQLLLDIPNVMVQYGYCGDP